MLKACNAKIPPANVGDTVIITIAKLDVMISLGSKNLMGVIMNNENDLYSIRTDQGVLTSCYSRNQFEVCQTKFLKISTVPDKTITQTTAMQNASLFVMQTCKCKNCSNSRCLCRTNNKRCNSRCHYGKSCRNKA